MADDLDPNAFDHLASGIRLAGALIPAAGPVLAELLTEVIPSQRKDRLVEYMRRLDYRLQVVEADMAGARDVFERNARSEYGTAIIEDSMIQSARTVEPESRERIAALVVRSLTEEELQYERTRKLLNLYIDLTYSEVIHLLYAALFSTAAGHTKDDFYSAHEAVLRPEFPAQDPASVDLERASFVSSYENQLIRLGLVSEISDEGRDRLQPTGIGAALARLIVLESDYRPVTGQD